MKIGRYCMEHGCDLKLVGKRKYIAFNGHKWVISDYVCKRCGRKDDEVEDFNTGLCVFDEKRQELEKKMKKHSKEAIKNYKEGCKKLMKEISEVIKKRWEKTKDENLRRFDKLEAEAFKYECDLPLRKN